MRTFSVMQGEARGEGLIAPTSLEGSVASLSDPLASPAPSGEVPVASAVPQDWEQVQTITEMPVVVIVASVCDQPAAALNSVSGQAAIRSREGAWLHLGTEIIWPAPPLAGC
jgi:hypothetical protein